MSRILVIGSANMDYTVRMERLPQMGETVSGGEFYSAFGGKGANQAVAAARAGGQVRFVARLGGDASGDAIAARLAAEGIDISAVQRDEDHPTGVALIMVDRFGNNAIAVAPGSNRRMSVPDLEGIADYFAWANILLIQMEIPLPAVEAALKMARDRSVTTILNPAPAAALSDKTLSLVDILTPNASEAAILSGRAVENRDAAVMAAMTLVRAGVKNVVATLGDDGACWINPEGVARFRAIPVEAVDATGAGDAFNGALACALAEGKPLNEAIPFACAAGALAVTRRGAQSSIPTREQIEGLLEEHG